MEFLFEALSRSQPAIESHLGDDEQEIEYQNKNILDHEDKT